MQQRIYRCRRLNSSLNQNHNACPRGGVRPRPAVHATTRPCVAGACARPARPHRRRHHWCAATTTQIRLVIATEARALRLLAVPRAVMIRVVLRVCGLDVVGNRRHHRYSKEIFEWKKCRVENESSQQQWGERQADVWQVSEQQQDPKLQQTTMTLTVCRRRCDMRWRGAYQKKVWHCYQQTKDEAGAAVWAGRRWQGGRADNVVRRSPTSPRRLVAAAAWAQWRRHRRSRRPTSR
mmetsp:Transcript_16745/g.28934  ORF Transcript_16745/g.28934 Transcript_16745/m.28934 type:complete len:236 (-) Transcript_16745:150-857(-)